MASFHLRSISLPSTSHPLTASLEEQLSKLKASRSTSIAHKLAGLKELYECFDDFLQLSLAQQTLSHEKQNQSVEEALDGSMGLLDMCSATRDFYSQMREFVQGLESSLRRKRGGESGCNEVDAYMVSRKILNKVICKFLRNLKKQRKTNSNSNSVKSVIMLKDVEVKSVVMLKDVEEISTEVFESVLSFISQPKTKSKLSIVSKFLQSKHVREVGVDASEIDKVDAELLVLKYGKDFNQAQNALKGLEALELSLQEVEEELECVYRRLVKIRVSLLNVLNH